MINASSKLAYVSICVSSGYFVYDAVDIVASNYRTGVSTQSREVLIHHVLIVSIFSVPLALNTFVGYTILALSIEFNTIWLHLRFMIAFNPHNRATTAFTCVSLTNLGKTTTKNNNKKPQQSISHLLIALALVISYLCGLSFAHAVLYDALVAAQPSPH